jgi:hypothetical protein
MTEPLFRYRQSVALTGYCWEDLELADGGWETVLDFDKRGERDPLLEQPELRTYDPQPESRTYDPLRDESALFMNLADLPPEPEAILSFANRYGPLGLNLPERYVDPRSKRRVEHWFCLDSLVTWQAAVRWLQYFVHLWRLTRAGDALGLARLIATRGSEAMFANVPLAPLEEEKLHPDALLLSDVEDRGFARQDPEGAALLFVQARLNVALGGCVSPAVVWDKDSMRSILSFNVSSLWGAILVQFAQAIVENRDYQHCAACGRWMELAPGVSRSDRLTCSDACRQKLHRMRHQQALELLAAGKKPATIARETGSDVATVRRWIAKLKEER